jgi:hypothetical protein
MFSEFNVMGYEAIKFIETGTYFMNLLIIDSFSADFSVLNGRILDKTDMLLINMCHGVRTAVSRIFAGRMKSVCRGDYDGGRESTLYLSNKSGKLRFARPDEIYDEYGMSAFDATLV